MSDFNRVTEKNRPGNTLWLVEAEWRGGHDRRVIRLQNIYTSEAAALEAWKQMTVEKHLANHNHGRLPEYRLTDSDFNFVRHPIRRFEEQTNA